MKRALMLILLLAACRQEAEQAIDPVTLSASSVGHFCQMNLLEHPGPKAQVHLDGIPGAPLFFSQVRDAVAYARLPEQDHVILAIWVNDMGAPGATWENPGATNWIDAQTAHYVVGSDQAGGMGAPELVPFADISAAAAFADAHDGTVSALDAIPDAAVIAPVALQPGEGDDADFRDRLRALSQRPEG
nr:nitrous oxide reductase maturation protein, outer-membrane lipoprotein [uncultured bacterium]